MSNEGVSESTGFVLGLNEATMGLFAAAILLAGAVLWSSHSPNVEKTDFSLTYVGARIVHAGLGARLYDINFQKQVRDSLFEHPNPLFYEHPPFEALLLSPLAALSFRTSYMCWGFFNAVVWLSLMFFLRQYLPWPREDLAYLCLWFLFAPVGVALFQGQSSIVLLALYVGSNSEQGYGSASDWSSCNLFCPLHSFSWYAENGDFSQGLRRQHFSLGFFLCWRWAGEAL
jgi:hypothetical protein